MNPVYWKVIDGVRREVATTCGKVIDCKVLDQMPTPIRALWWGMYHRPGFALQPPEDLLNAQVAGIRT